MIVKIIRIPVKIVMLPALAALTVIRWIGIFVTGFSSVIFNILAGLFFLCGVLSWLMGISSRHEALSMLIAGFVVFIVPVVMEWLIAGITALAYMMRDFIRS